MNIRGSCLIPIMCYYSNMGLYPDVHLKNNSSDSLDVKMTWGPNEIKIGAQWKVLKAEAKIGNLIAEAACGPGKKATLGTGVAVWYDVSVLVNDKVKALRSNIPGSAELRYDGSITQL